MKTLRELAACASAEMPDGGTAHLVPIPVLRDGFLRAAVLEYPRSHEPRVPSTFYPPRRLLLLDVDSGDLVTITGVVPSDVGPNWPAHEALPSQGLPRASSVADWQAKRDRLDVLAPFVWIAFARGVPLLDADGRREVAEYIELSERTEPDALWPYMRAVGHDFYAWAGRIGALQAAR